MESEKKPMDAAELTELREELERGYLDSYGKTRVADLLAAHDYHEQRAAELLAGLMRVRHVGRDAYLYERSETHRRQWGRVMETVDRLTAGGCPSDRADQSDAPTELEAAYERARAEVARLRARVRVEAEDVERAGVTRQHVEAWLHGNGWKPAKGIGHTPSGGRFVNWMMKRNVYTSVFDLGHADQLAGNVNTISLETKRTPLDILDEVAAMAVAE